MWGYTISDTDELVPMLSVLEFNTMTANKYSGDVRTEGNLYAASMAIRDFCGWHVFPEHECVFTERLLAQNGRVKRVNTDIIIQLPATFVSAVSSVAIDGEPSEDFAFETNGMVRIFDVYCHQVTRKTVIQITYTAGVPSGLMDAAKELVAHKVTHALASSNGVQSETAGGVSITYASGWINSAGAGTLASEGKEALTPYRVRGVF